MAISVMKKVQIIAEQDNKERLLESLQEMQGTEIVAFEEELIEEDSIDFARDDGKAKNLHYELAKVKEALSCLNRYVPQASMLKKMTQKRERLTLQELEARVDQIDAKDLCQSVLHYEERIDYIDKRLDELAEEEAFVRKWSNLSLNPNHLRRLDHFNAFVGSIDTEDATDFIDKIKEVADEIFIREIYYSDDDSGYLILCDREMTEDVKQAIAATDFKILDYKYTKLPKEELDLVLKNRKDLVASRKEYVEKLKSLDEEYQQLRLVKEHYSNLIEREKASNLLLNSQYMFVLKGWMEAEKVDENIENVRRKLGDDAFAYFIYDVQGDEIDEVPTQLKNNFFNRPFEILTKQFAIPKYNEIDPTPFYSLFHVLFFGLMSADLGYGLLLFLATLIPILFFDLNQGMKQNLMMFNFMSIGTMLVGLFFGSFFGYDLPFRVMSLSDQVIEVMVLCVLIGIIHMLLGYAIKAYLEAKEKNYVSMYLDAVQWFLMLVGVLILGANALLDLNIDSLQTIGIWLVLGNIIGMFVVNIFTNGNPFIGFGQGLFGMISVAGLVGDIVSYTRLTALGVAGANIAMAFNLIVGLFPPIARFTIGILLFIALHALNIFITYLGAYVHSMRLEFVEFFGKFFDGGGREFKPLKPVEEEVWIERKQN